MSRNNDWVSDFFKCVDQTHDGRQYACLFSEKTISVCDSEELSKKVTEYLVECIRGN